MKNRSIVLICVLALLIAYSVSALAADVLIRESWYVIEAQGKIGGFVCDQKWQTENGFRYSTDMTTLMEMLGGQPMQMTQHLEEVIDGDFRPVSFSQYAVTNNSQTVMKVEFATDEIRVTVTADGGKEYTSIWKQTEPILLSTSLLEELVQQGLRVGAEKEGLVWVYSENKVEKGLVRVEKQVEYEYNGQTVPAFEIVSMEGESETREIIGADGELYWTETTTGTPVIIRKTEKDQIPQLEAIETDVLLIPGNIQVSRPFSSLTSEITVGWKEIPFEDFQWEDNRQKVKEHTVNGDEHQVTVTLAKDERDFTGRVQLPVNDPALEKYLADSQYIMPSLPAVQDLAKQILGGEKDGWTAVQKLNDWVYGNIASAMIPETLTAEQILEKKSGKCVEYAVIFASLARSAGLPTRVALGERYQDNMWIGHMWNEVWMGDEWITVDASHNQVAPDALLLKFVDSDTVMGTQPVRQRLTGNLQIRIDDVKLAGSAVSELKTGIVGQLYTNAEYACQLSVPDHWTSMEAVDQGAPLLIMQPEGVPTVQAILVLFSVPAGTPPELIMNARIPAIQNLLPGFELTGQEAMTLLDQHAVLATWTFTQDIRYQQQNLIMITGDLGYIFVFSAPADQWEDYQPGFAAVLQGFSMIQ